MMIVYSMSINSQLCVTNVLQVLNSSVRSSLHLLTTSNAIDAPLCKLFDDEMYGAVANDSE